MKRRITCTLVRCTILFLSDMRYPLIWFALVPVIAPAMAQKPEQPPRPAALDVIRAFDAVTKRDLWPGYRPDTIPLAIFDGQRTWLVRHRSPPNEFRPTPYGPTILAMDGRQPEVTANSSAKIGGRITATLAPNLGASSPREWASVAAHEAFHAYQRTKHPTWIANEASLFTYPWDDTEALAARRLEFDALRRALSEKNPDAAACWAALALADRDARFARLGAAAAAYETRNELNEGLAQYVQDVAAGKSALENMPEQEFAPDAVRDRVYRSGSAMGQLLDRFDRSWRRQLENGDTTETLHGVLRRALVTLRKAASHDGPASCAHSDAERRAAMVRAEGDVSALAARHAAERTTFTERPGWSIVVDAGASTLGLAGFDPLNVSRLTPSDILHRRYVKFANASGELESIDHEVLTVGVGPHPLFNGVKLALVTGLSSAPTVDDSVGVVALHHGELKLRFTGATLTRDGQRLLIRLGGK